MGQDLALGYAISQSVHYSRWNRPASPVMNQTIFGHCRNVHTSSKHSPANNLLICPRACHRTQQKNMIRESISSPGFHLHPVLCQPFQHKNPGAVVELKVMWVAWLAFSLTKQGSWNGHLKPGNLTAFSSANLGSSYCISWICADCFFVQ